MERFLSGQLFIKTILMSRILIIEDEAAIRRVLTKILSEENETTRYIRQRMD